jgi:SNF2 family DNA or RNA helicase
VYRQGQKAEHVFVYHIVAKDTLDGHVLKTLGEKDRTQKDLVDRLRSIKSTCISP